MITLWNRYIIYEKNKIPYCLLCYFFVLLKYKKTKKINLDTQDFNPRATPVSATPIPSRGQTTGNTHTPLLPSTQDIYTPAPHAYSSEKTPAQPKNLKQLFQFSQFPYLWQSLFPFLSHQKEMERLCQECCKNNLEAATLESQIEISKDQLLKLDQAKENNENLKYFLKRYHHRKNQADAKAKSTTNGLFNPESINTLMESKLTKLCKRENNALSTFIITKALLFFIPVRIFCTILASLCSCVIRNPKMLRAIEQRLSFVVSAGLILLAAREWHLGEQSISNTFSSALKYIGCASLGILLLATVIDLSLKKMYFGDMDTQCRKLESNMDTSSTILFNLTVDPKVTIEYISTLNEIDTGNEKDIAHHFKKKSKKEKGHERKIRFSSFDITHTRDPV